MMTGLKEVRALPGFQLKLCFQNGSEARVNLKNRIRTMRFSRLAAPGVFDTAQIEGEKVVWLDKDGPISIWCSELFDSMLLD